MSDQQNVPYQDLIDLCKCIVSISDAVQAVLKGQVEQARMTHELCDAMKSSLLDMCGVLPQFHAVSQCPGSGNQCKHRF